MCATSPPSRWLSRCWPGRAPSPPTCCSPDAPAGNLLLTGLLLAVVVVVAARCFVAFLLAGRISRLLGMTGNIVLSRLLGVLLAALAVQYVVDGIRAVWPA